MSYNVEIPATIREEAFREASMSVTTFGGGERGRMVQLTIDGRYVQLTAEQLDTLIDVLSFARRQSLADWPKRQRQRRRWQPF